MPGYRACALVCVAPLLLLCSSICEAQTFAAQGCLVPPQGAKVYPFYALQQSRGSCSLLSGDYSGPGINNFGGDAQ